MKLLFNAFFILLYIVAGLILTPFVAWSFFFATVPATWRSLRSKGKKQAEISDPDFAVYYQNKSGKA